MAPRSYVGGGLGPLGPRFLTHGQVAAGDAFLALEAFFRLPYYEVFAQHLVPRPVEPIVLTADFELAQSLILTPQTPLYFSARSLNVLELRGMSFLPVVIWLLGFVVMLEQCWSLKRISVEVIVESDGACFLLTWWHGWLLHSTVLCRVRP